MRQHSIDDCLKNGFEYNSIINRAVITKGVPNEYYVTLKPKMFVLDMFPSFSHVMLVVSEGKVIERQEHRHYALYAIFLLFYALIFISSLSLNRSYAVCQIIFLTLVILFKIYGNRQLKSVSNRIV